MVEPEGGVSTEILDEILEHLDNHDFEYALDMVKELERPTCIMLCLKASLWRMERLDFRNGWDGRKKE